VLPGDSPRYLNRYNGCGSKHQVNDMELQRAAHRPQPVTGGAPTQQLPGWCSIRSPSTTTACWSWSATRLGHDAGANFVSRLTWSEPLRLTFFSVPDFPMYGSHVHVVAGTL
jgi:hypothetical protein